MANTFNGKPNKFGKKEPNIKLDFIDKNKGFSDEKGNLREELITIEAEEIAKTFVIDRLSTSQLRAFFNEVKAINNRLDDKEENWNSIYPSILLIKSKIEYRAVKDDKMLNFKEFLLKSVAFIQKENRAGKGYKTFKDFVIFFEAIVGYSYGLGLK